MAATASSSCCQRHRTQPLNDDAPAPFLLQTSAAPVRPTQDPHPGLVSDEQCQQEGKGPCHQIVWDQCGWLICGSKYT
jgi:hypothetical protein